MRLRGANIKAMIEGKAAAALHGGFPLDTRPASLDTRGMTKKKILVVDDDKALSRMVKLGLEQTGRYEVRVENDARNALAAALSFRPDLMLLDVIMPDKDGGTVASEIRQDKNLKNTPVIFLTSILGKDEAADRGGKLGKEPVLAKPVSADELLKKIEECLG